MCVFRWETIGFETRNSVYYDNAFIIIFAYLISKKLYNLKLYSFLFVLNIVYNILQIYIVSTLNISLFLWEYYNFNIRYYSINYKLCLQTGRNIIDNTCCWQRVLSYFIRCGNNNTRIVSSLCCQQHCAGLNQILDRRNHCQTI